MMAWSTARVIASVLSHFGVTRGPLAQSLTMDAIVDDRGRLVATTRDLVGGTGAPEALWAAIEPYIDSVRIFEGKLKVAL